MAGRILRSKFLTVFVTFAMVMSGDGVAYGTRAFAETIDEQTRAILAVDDDEGIVAAPPGEDALEDAEDEPQPLGSEDDSLEEVHETPALEGSTGGEQDRGVVRGDVPVRLSFTLDGERTAPPSLTLTLERRTQTWDEAAGEWTTADNRQDNAGWERVLDDETGDPVAVHLRADEARAALEAAQADEDETNDDIIYIFRQQPVQTTTDDGGSKKRFEYRAVVSSIDGTSEDVTSSNATLASTDDTAHTQTYAVDAADTKAETTDYTIAVSTEPVLRAKGDAATADEATVAKHEIVVTGVSALQGDETLEPIAPGDAAGEDDSAIVPADADDGSDESAYEQVPTLLDASEGRTIMADLPVTVSFRQDGHATDAHAITLQVQRRTQLWDIVAGTWGERSAWEDLEGTAVALSAGDVLGAEDATYTFEDLAVQVFDGEDQPVARHEYRVVETSLSGAELAYDRTEDGVLTYTGEVTLDEVTYDIVATTSDEAAAKAVDTKDGDVEADVQPVEIANELNMRRSLLTRFLGLFGVGAGANRDGEGEGDDGQGGNADPTEEIEHPAATGNPVRTVNVDDETERVTVSFAYTIHNDTRNYADNGQIVFHLNGINSGSVVTVKNQYGDVVYDSRIEIEYEYGIEYDGREIDFAVPEPYAGTLVIEITVPEDAPDFEPCIQFRRPFDNVSMTNRCENYQNNTFYPLENGMTFYSQQAAQLVTTRKIWRDASKSDKNLDGMTLQLQYRVMPPVSDDGTSQGSGGSTGEGTSSGDGTTSGTGDAGNQNASGTTGTTGDWITGTYGPALQQSLINQKLAGDADLKTETAWVYNFSKQLYTYTYTDAGWQPIEYRLTETVDAQHAEHFEYVISYDNSDNTLINTLKQELTYHVSWMDNNDSFDTRLDFVSLLNNLKISKGATGDTPDVTTFSEIIADSTYTVLEQDGQGNPTKISFTNAEDPEYDTYVTDEGNGAWTIYLPNALAYNENGNRIHYGLDTVSPGNATTATPNRGGDIAAAATDTSQQNAAGSSAFNPQSPTTQYTTLYNNADEYSSRQTALYTDGTLKLTLYNTAGFSFDKRWKDNGAVDNRPNVKFVLYRYVEGSNYQSASPVPLVATETGTKQDETIVLGANVTLPYFNDAGQRYVYFVKETLSNNAIMVSSQQGDAYVPARVRTENGVTVQDLATENDWESTGLPYYDVTNGGTLENRLTGTTDIIATKEWIAAARQDVSARVTFDVYRATAEDPTFLKVESAADLYHDSSLTKSASVTLSGFGAESTYETFSYNEMQHGSSANSYAKSKLPKYDADGETYLYQLREASVATMVGASYQDAYQNTTPGATGTSHFLTKDGYRYRQEVSQVPFDESGRTRISITNILVGNAEIDIEKTFPDGLQPWHVGGTLPLEFNIFRNGTKVGTKLLTIDTTTDLVPISAGSTGLKLSQTAADALKLTDYSQLTSVEAGFPSSGLLPRYDETGTEYVYTVTEVPIPGYGNSNSISKSEKDVPNPDFPIDATTNADEKVLVVTDKEVNYINPGDPTISVSKQWNDAEETLYRQVVQYRIEMHPKVASGDPTDSWYALVTDGSDLTAISIHDPSFDPRMYTGTISPNQEFVLQPIRTDVISSFIDTTGDKNARYWVNGETVHHTEQGTTTEQTNNKAWKKNGYPATPNEDGIAIRIVEVSVGDHEVTDETVETYDTVQDGVRKRPNYVVADSTVNNDNPEGADYRPEHRDGYDYVETSEQNYDVETYTKGTKGKYDLGITNTRVGVETVDLTKVWKDGNN